MPDLTNGAMKGPMHDLASAPTVTLSALCAALGLPAPRAEVHVSHVTFDSRTVGPGTLFVAAPGATPTSADGHAFIPQAVAAGAAAVLLEQDAARWAEELDVPVLDARACAGVGSENKPGTAALAGAVCADVLYGQPSHHTELVGITGTNGKTTVAFMLASLSDALATPAALLGTVGAGPASAPVSIGYTTPPAPALSRVLAELVREGARVGTTAVGAQRIAMEVSSHAITTGRAAAQRFAAVAFTSFSQDHLDFHASLEEYLGEKLRLVSTMRPKGAPCVVPAPPAGAPADDWRRRVLALAPDALTVGQHAGATLRAEDVEARADGVAFSLVHGTTRIAAQAPVIGDYNVDNLLVATGLLVALGHDLADVAAAYRALVVAPGRMQAVGPADGSVRHDAPSNVPAVVVDFAHTPDAIENALAALRPLTRGALWIVCGAGGDRDPLKRAPMGEAAADGADHVLITDDNPRFEDPAAIRAAVAAGAAGHPDARTVGSRADAIRMAIAEAGADDVVLIAGKGHEKTQEIAGSKLPFDDVAIARAALTGALPHTSDPRAPSVAPRANSGRTESNS